jgi:hypothetical protein
MTGFGMDKACSLISFFDAYTVDNISKCNYMIDLIIIWLGFKL